MSETITDNPAKPAVRRDSFFRQSGWLMIANISAGFFMWAVHFLSKVTGPEEYGVFVAFLAVALCIPAMPLQMVIAQQTAKALATKREHELSSLIRVFWIGSTLVWAVLAILAVIFQNELLQRWKVDNAAGLYITLGIVLVSIWVPIFSGVLQGRQNFLWYGWSMIANGVLRVAVAGLAVYLGARAAGMLGGVLVGIALAAFIGIWQCKDLWSISPAPFDGKAVLRQIIPLVLGFGTFQFLFTADTIYAKAYFDPDTVGFYGSAGTLSRALMWLVGPLAAVMFPRLVHSSAKSESSNLMNLVFLGTAVLAIVGAAGVSVLGPFAVRIVSGEKFVAVASTLLPWYAFAMVPLALGNVLLNSLMAKMDFRCVPLLAILAVGYGVALTKFNATPLHLLRTMAACNLVMLAICAWYHWVKPAAAREPAAAV